jgi:phenylacetic acid degradation operon negative regulatory protein
VIDGGEATAPRRAKLRQTLGWAGLGVVAPNVMASPVVPATVAADAVARVGGFANVLVSRSLVVEGESTIGPEELARRCVDLDATGERYAEFVERFGRFEDATVADLDDAEAFKLRTLLVASFRRIVLAAPQVPDQLLPADWIGHRARGLTGGLYAAIAAQSERHFGRVVGTELAASPPTDRFTG